LCATTARCGQTQGDICKAVPDSISTVVHSSVAAYALTWSRTPEHRQSS
jgi:hypothetical protein